MMNCWKDEPSERPEFSTITALLRKLLDDWQVSAACFTLPLLPSENHQATFVLPQYQVS